MNVINKLNIENKDVNSADSLKELIENKKETETVNNNSLASVIKSKK